MRKQISVIIALLIMILAGAGIIFYFFHGEEAEREFKQLETTGDGFDLLAIWEKNQDTIGWIKIPNTGIDYPVMRGEKYLHKNFDGEYSESGTPFVQDDWTPESMNSLIYGHNMWVQGNMFNPLHEYEDEEYWLQHKEGVFYVIAETPTGKIVQERKFSLEHIVRANVKKGFVWQSYVNVPSNKDLQPYLDWCEEEEIHKSGIVRPTGYGVVTLCTCSYHIRGDRSAGRLLTVGPITEVERL